ncbi:hypothetical protein CGRA01v4_09719 [Colletotrichum graminicola]|nr:hypothetical protein CGRA01v4_09719 [Colletotrichum graminicola]
MGKKRVTLFSPSFPHVLVITHTSLTKQKKTDPTPTHTSSNGQSRGPVGDAGKVRAKLARMRDACGWGERLWVMGWFWPRSIGHGRGIDGGDMCLGRVDRRVRGQETFFWTSAKTMGGGWRTSRRVWP